MYHNQQLSSGGLFSYHPEEQQPFAIGCRWEDRTLTRNNEYIMSSLLEYLKDIYSYHYSIFENRPFTQGLKRTTTELVPKKEKDFLSFEPGPRLVFGRTELTEVSLFDPLDIRFIYCMAKGYNNQRIARLILEEINKNKEQGREVS